MKLTLEPTRAIESVNGTPCRVWVGITEEGTEVKAWVACVQPQTHDAERLSTFDRTLKALPYPEPSIAIDLRFII